MAYKLTLQPPPLTKEKGYERYKNELLAWIRVTEVPKNKQAITVALSLPENYENGIRERVFDELSLDNLQADGGLDVLIQFLDKHLGKDDLVDCLEKYEDFEEFKREENQSFIDFVAKFDQKYNKIVKLNMKLPSPILAFMLLRKSNITKEEKMLVMTGMDYAKKDELYDQAKTSLLKFKGEQGSGNNKSRGSPVGLAVKLEAVNVSESEEATYWTRGYSGSSRQRGRGRAYHRYSRGRIINSESRDRVNSSQARGKRNINPAGSDGRTLLCRACGSYRHLIADCPDSWEKIGHVNITEEEEKGNLGDSECLFLSNVSDEDIVYLTKMDNKERSVLCKEARKCAVLDSACSSTVCGEEWMEDYLLSLTPEDRDKVIFEESGKIFKFGGGERLQSIGKCVIPIVIVDKEVMLATDVEKSEIPLLLSKCTMKKANMILDLKNDTAEIYGVKVMLNETSSGHYCIPIDRNEMTPVETVCAVSVDNLDKKEQYKMLLKLHRQFAHPTSSKLKDLLKNANAWKVEFDSMLININEKCEICKVHSRTPSNSVVSLPMASTFNEKVCMDLKKWGNRWILHMIDMWSRFSVSVFVDRKKPSDIIDKIMTSWVGAGFGIMKCILTDNGGEFSSDEMREVCSILNVQTLTTAAFSPFQNGLCERNHAVIDNMLKKMVDSCPGTPIEILLAWANMAKNSLQMWHGFSSYQLVFGVNPKLPNVMTDQLPALEGTSTSEILVKHLNSLHAARRAFIETESDERVRRALRNKIRSSETLYNNGDKVYYKREFSDRWLGPAKVIFQDDKVIFVRHGGIYVRVSPNRLMKANNVLSRDEDCKGHENSTVRTTRGDEFEYPNDKFYSDDIILEENENQDENEIFEEPASVKNLHAKGEKIDLKKNEVIRYRTEESDEWVEAKVLNRAGKATGIHRNWFNVKNNDGIAKSIDLDNIEEWEKVSEEDEVCIVVIPKERHEEEKCVAAKWVELNKLKEFDVYEEVPDEDQFRISTTWVLWNKGKEVRARLVARGYEDMHDYPRDSPTINKASMRIILSITVNKGWKIQTTDIKSAFLQGKLLDREVFLSPPKEIKRYGFLWKLKRCLYGLNDAARQFYQSVTECLGNLGCTQSKLDPALFYKTNCHGELIGFLACHVDDFLHAGTQDFDNNVMRKLYDRFLVGKVEFSDFRYIGFHVFQDNNSIILDQTM